MVDANPDFAGDGDGASSTTATTSTPTSGDCADSCELLGQQLTCVEGVCLGVVELELGADSFVRDDEPDTNFGSADLLHVEQGMRTQRSFIGLAELATLDAELDARAGEVLSLTLELDFKRGGAEVGVRRVAEAWAEDSVTWAGAPATDGDPLWAGAVADGKQSLDLLAVPVDWRTELDHGVGLWWRPGGGEPHLELFARESGRGPRVQALVRW